MMLNLSNAPLRATYSKPSLQSYTRGGLLKYDLGRDVPLRLEKLTHFYTKFCQKMRPIFIPEPQILSKIN